MRPLDQGKTKRPLTHTRARRFSATRKEICSEGKEVKQEESTVADLRKTPFSIARTPFTLDEPPSVLRQSQLGSFQFCFSMLCRRRCVQRKQHPPTTFLRGNEHEKRQEKIKEVILFRGHCSNIVLASMRIPCNKHVTTKTVQYQQWFLYANVCQTRTRLSRVTRRKPEEEIGSICHRVRARRNNVFIHLSIC